MPILYGGMRSRAFRVRWMLEELGLDYQFFPVGPHSPEVLAHNPSGKIPVFVADDGTVITDSTAILTYLADSTGQFTAQPGTTQRAQQDAVLHRVLDELDGVLWTASKHSFVLPEKLRVKQVKETNKREFARTLAMMADRFEGPYLMGERFTVPDIVFTHCLGWAIVAKFDPMPTAFDDYFDAMRSRPAYRAAQSQG